MTWSSKEESEPPDTSDTAPDGGQSTTDLKHTFIMDLDTFRMTEQIVMMTSYLTLNVLLRDITSGSGVWLTIQAAWTASDRFPASGSHQNT